MIYKEYKTGSGETAVQLIREDGSSASFLMDEANTDYQAYLKWLEEGNQPLPADEPAA